MGFFDEITEEELGKRFQEMSESGNLDGTSIPEEGGFERDYAMKVTGAYFQIDRKYAEASGGQESIQLVLEGYKVQEDGTLGDVLRSEKMSIGKGHNLVRPTPKGEGIIASDRIVPADPKKPAINGSSNYGTFIRQLTLEWGKTEANKENFPRTINGKCSWFSPKGVMFVLWLSQRGFAHPDWLDANIWIGVTLQFANVPWRMRSDPPDKMRDRTAPVDILDAEPVAGKGGSSGVNGSGGKKVTKAATAPATASATAPTATAVAEEVDVDEMKWGVLMTLARENDTFAAFRKAAMNLPEVAGNQTLRTYVMAGDTYKNLRNGGV